jgi:hypothetical protein
MLAISYQDALHIIMILGIRIWSFTGTSVQSSSSSSSGGGGGGGGGGRSSSNSDNNN